MLTSQTIQVAQDRCFQSEIEKKLSYHDTHTHGGLGKQNRLNFEGFWRHLVPSTTDTVCKGLETKHKMKQ